MLSNHKLNRREIVAIGVSAWASLAAGLYVFPRARAFGQGVPVRRSIHTLVRADGTHEPELAAYIEALKTLQENHPILWDTIRNLHDVFCVGAGDKEVHGNWSFVPWHRAFLVTYERLLREVSGNTSVVVPYWDWYAGDEFPAVFQSGPLNHDARDIQSRPINDADRGYGGPESSNYDKFAAFGIGVPFDPQSFFGGNIPLGSFLGAGRPEFGGHGGIHNYVGGNTGDMADLNRSSRDPCFYSHHANIDRLMELWKAKVRGGDNKWRTESGDWLKTEFEFRFDNTRTYVYRVSDLLDTEGVVDIDGEQLGYSYDTLQAGVPIAAVVPWSQIIRLERTAEGTDSSASAQPMAAGSTEPSSAMLSFNPPTQVISFGSLDVTSSVARTEEVALSAPAQNILGKFLNRDRSAEFGTFGLDAPAMPTRNILARVILRLENVRIPPRNAQINFFINTPAPTYSEVAQSDNYLGSFNYIPSRKDSVEVARIDIDVSKKLRDRINELNKLQISAITQYLSADDPPISIGNVSLVVE